ncbi:MAG: hypothetical protein ABI378_13235 [Chitinophagaceae bacterium]
MKSFFNLALLLAVLQSGNCLSAQTIPTGWSAYNDTAAKINFGLPVAAISVDSLHTRFYAGIVDSLLAIQVHIFDSAYVNSSEGLFGGALTQESGDTLRAIAKLILFATKIDLLSLSNITVDSNNGIEIGLDYKTLQSDIPTLTFIRYFLLNHNFIVFTITGSKNDLPRYLSYKSDFFGTIEFY